MQFHYVGHRQGALPHSRPGRFRREEPDGEEARLAQRRGGNAGRRGRAAHLLKQPEQEQGPSQRRPEYIKEDR